MPRGKLCFFFLLFLTLFFFFLIGVLLEVKDPTQPVSHIRFRYLSVSIFPFKVVKCECVFILLMGRLQVGLISLVSLVLAPPLIEDESDFLRLV